MASWAEFAAAEPAFAGKVADRFAVRKHKTLATLRKELYLGMMPGSRKLHDLQRDPRLALHSPTEDPPDQRPAGWSGEAKISGRGVPVDAADSTQGPRFCIDIGEVVLTHLNDAGDRLVVESWRPGQGRRRIERR